MKEKMVTRTVTRFIADLLMVNNETYTTTILTVEMPFMAEEKLLAYAKKHFETEEKTVAKVIKVTFSTSLLGMPESVFIANAIELEPRKKAEEPTVDETAN